ncbi:hypothetical protein [Hyalangium rubrum]|uniref:Type 4 fimbrial biogenesis protein PilX N-terminal domain-containing protein n=1 Tax=Hyalangium rubrum TaxID=3103134 RepID=A0ABU5H4D8_9BACT|nr:hypothetical protein [Hyalangium sp. s54d21]MDY7227652.1 hypothetical protein [Hyalangium sp. s54d21]
MKRLTPHPRGMALVLAMVVVVLITMLVAGAISFTGTERAASLMQTQEDQMSSCIQAARNLFISRMRMIPATSVETVTFDEQMNGARVATGHFGRVTVNSVTDTTSSVQDANINVMAIDQTPGNPQPVKFYAVTAVCQEVANDPSSPEREVEFLVKVGL